jgi:lysyl-tRNA synthetase class 2
MMLAVSGGAAARPFVTHHHALDLDLYLRVAPELNLKRLVVGGFERVFEINRNFRNEGLSPKHNPEFTMLEFYRAYADYEDLMDFTEEMLRAVALSACGTTRVTWQGTSFDLAAPIPRLTVGEMLVQRAGVAVEELTDRAALARRAVAAGLAVDAEAGTGRLAFELFEALVEPHITSPVFVTRLPIEVSPLARRSDDDPDATDRFELFACGREIANGFSELNDAEDQAARFAAQAQRRSRGDEDAMQYDADYVTALEYGLPPTAGEGVGIDRFVMLLTDQPHIRDVLLFPHMRPQRPGGGEAPA